MITIEERITVTHDEPLAQESCKHLFEKDGWQISEDTTAVTYKRIDWINSNTVTYKRNGLISLKEEKE